MADTTARKRKKSLFESIFGVIDQPEAERKERRQRRLFGEKWWNENDRPQRRPHHQWPGIARRHPPQTRNRRRPAMTIPKAIPASAWATSPMRPTSWSRSRRLEIRRTAPGGSPRAGLVYDALDRRRTPTIRVRPDVRDALADHYKRQNFRPMWFENGKLLAARRRGPEGPGRRRCRRPRSASYLPRQPAGV